ncbi:hypothetical protein Tco_0747352 [Tanacetum coccineum]|uniref:Uncharacterized protein n=1 Tax=Tanacetum coccineum TaxID=301880 RepID=A0ABQ4YTI1_9ASTR
MFPRRPIYPLILLTLRHAPPSPPLPHRYCCHHRRTINITIISSPSPPAATSPSSPFHRRHHHATTTATTTTVTPRGAWWFFYAQGCLFALHSTKRNGALDGQYSVFNGPEYAVLIFLNEYAVLDKKVRYAIPNDLLTDAIRETQAYKDFVKKYEGKNRKGKQVAGESGSPKTSLKISGLSVGKRGDSMGGGGRRGGGIKPIIQGKLEEIVDNDDKKNDDDKHNDAKDDKNNDDWNGYLTKRRKTKQKATNQDTNEKFEGAKPNQEVLRGEFARPLPLSLYIPPPIDRKDDILESGQPPRKRLCLSTLGSRYEIRKSSTARPTRGQGIDYGFVSTVDAEERQQGIRDVGYEDAQDSRSRISQRVDMDSQRVDLLMRDKMTLQETMTHQELQTHHDHVYAHETHLQAHQTQLQLQSTLIQTQHQVHETRFQMQQAELAALQETDRRCQDQMVETLRVIRDMRWEMSDMQAELLSLGGQQRRARQPGPEARILDHQDASGDADSHI